MLLSWCVFAEQGSQCGVHCSSRRLSSRQPGKKKSQCRQTHKSPRATSHPAASRRAAAVKLRVGARRLRADREWRARHYTSVSNSKNKGGAALICTSAATRCGRSRRRSAHGSPMPSHASTLQHPNACELESGCCRRHPDGSWLPAADFHLRHEGTHSQTQPFSLEDIGYDFFLRVKTTKLVWFVDPTNGETVHSGAKAAGSKSKPGKRYCPLCQQCFSANNFVSQHLKNLHTPPPPTAPAVASDGQGGALLTWKVETCPPGAMPVGYQLESSTDNGASWEV